MGSLKVVFFHPKRLLEVTGGPCAAGTGSLGVVGGDGPQRDPAWGRYRERRRSPRRPRRKRGGRAPEAGSKRGNSRLFWGGSGVSLSLSLPKKAGGDSYFGGDAKLPPPSPTPPAAGFPGWGSVLNSALPQLYQPGPGSGHFPGRGGVNLFPDTPKLPPTRPRPRHTPAMVAPEATDHPHPRHGVTGARRGSTQGFACTRSGVHGCFGAHRAAPIGFYKVE